MTKRLERLVPGAITQLADREIGVLAASSQKARDGHVLCVSTMDTSNFEKNPITLFNHDAERPVGAASALGIDGGNLYARITFAPEGASRHADECCALAKAGVLKGVSIGFDVLDAEPLDPKQGSRGGLRITQSELLEISLVAVNADVNATVIARAHRARPGAISMLRALPRIPRSAVSRALGRIGERNFDAAPARPTGLLRPHELVEAVRQERAHHALLVWAAGADTREIEESMTHDARRARLRELER